MFSLGISSSMLKFGEGVRVTIDVYYIIMYLKMIYFIAMSETETLILALMHKLAETCYLLDPNSFKQSLYAITKL